jgi:uncharacterized protein (DUF1810 family)
MSEPPLAADPFRLERFVQAQAPVMDSVRRELAAGCKRSHWMWFVFPQLRGLGHSATARYFGIEGCQEAQAYLQHSVLGPRLIECTALVNAVSGRSAHEIFHSPDDLKFRSCMTLFSALPQAPAPFQQALDRYFGGVGDAFTLQQLQRN